jgi:hypothetical protein
MTHLYSHTDGVLYVSVLELMALLLGFVDGVGEATTTNPLDAFVFLLCPCCCGVVSGTMVEQG